MLTYNHISFTYISIVQLVLERHQGFFCNFFSVPKNLHNVQFSVHLFSYELNLIPKNSAVGCQGVGLQGYSGAGGEKGENKGKF